MSYFFDVSFDYLIGVTDIKTIRINYVNENISINLSDAEIELKHLKNFHDLPRDIKKYIFTLSDSFTWRIAFEKELNQKTERLHEHEDIAMENLTPTLANDENELLQSYRLLDSKLKNLLWDILRAWEKGSEQSNSVLQKKA